MTGTASSASAPPRGSRGVARRNPPRRRPDPTWRRRSRCGPTGRCRGRRSPGDETPGEPPRPEEEPGPVALAQARVADTGGALKRKRLVRRRPTRRPSRRAARERSPESAPSGGHMPLRAEPEVTLERREAEKDLRAGVLGVGKAGRRERRVGPQRPAARLPSRRGGEGSGGGTGSSPLPRCRPANAALPRRDDARERPAVCRARSASFSLSEKPWPRLRSRTRSGSFQEPGARPREMEEDDEVAEIRFGKGPAPSSARALSSA